MTRKLTAYTLMAIFVLTCIACRIDASAPRLIEPETWNIESSDEVTLVGYYYAPASETPRSATPGVLLLHMLNRSAADWKEEAEALAAEGYAVLAMDLRGHGESALVRQGLTVSPMQLTPDDFQAMLNDARLALDTLVERGGADPNRLAIIGASIGANIALSRAAVDPRVQVVALLSPGMDYRGVTLDQPIKRYGTRPLLIAAAEGDTYSAESARVLELLAQGNKELRMYSGDRHGTDMFAGSDLRRLILKWLAAGLNL